MKQFFSILFGGLLAILVGIGIAYGGSMLWRTMRTKLPEWRMSIHIPSLSDVSSAVSDVTDATTISGFARTIRFTADEEEDVLNAAAHSLPSSSVGKITATSYVVSNLTRGTTVDSRDADRILPIASLTKLVTAIIARRTIDPDERITIDRSTMATYGNTAQFKVGETFVAKDLYYPLLMVSSNDAAEAFAQAYGRRQFIALMNDFVQSIGAYRTYFDDPSGLSPRNISSASDMALIIDWIKKYDPDIIDITMQKARTVRGHTWINPTHFLNWSNYIGGKNGYTPEADRTTVSLFKLGAFGDVYVIVVLGSESRDQDVIQLLEKAR
jgi:serine-type D-Ala-D-Ala endopeptidase (penicillin-binding protein 7)